MFGIAPRFDVQIGVVARRALRLHGIVLVVRGQLLDLIEDLLADQVALLHPSRRARCGPHLDEAPVVIEHLHALAVLHHSGFFIHRCHAVAQVDLHSRNVGDLKHACRAPRLHAGQQHDARNDRGPNCDHSQAEMSG